MKLVFDKKALVDLEGIFYRIAKDNPVAARAVVERLLESTEHLATFPQMGHAGRDLGTFEWVVPRLPCIIVYELSAERETVIVVAVPARDKNVPVLDAESHVALCAQINYLLDVYR